MSVADYKGFLIGAQEGHVVPIHSNANQKGLR